MHGRTSLGASPLKLSPWVRSEELPLPPAASFVLLAIRLELQPAAWPFEREGLVVASVRLSCHSPAILSMVDRATTENTGLPYFGAGIDVGAHAVALVFCTFLLAAGDFTGLAGFGAAHVFALVFCTFLLAARDFAFAFDFAFSFLASL